MNRILILKLNLEDRKAAVALTLLVVAFVALTLTQDFLRSDLNNSAFYFSESFMFSSFWWLFAPLLFAQYFIIRQKITRRCYFYVTIIFVPIIVHLFAFPLLVWIISGIFYYHHFTFQQTFRYTLSEHLYLLVLLYAIPALTFVFFTKRTKAAASFAEIQNEAVRERFISSIVISEGYKKHLIMVADILYFSANSPYINVHLENKKHLYSETLKAVALQLNPNQFVRVHKSSIINIEKVASYITRLNGDYDLVMKNNVTLRVSRNYANNFKTLFNNTHQLASE